jgi:hypothetical protein
MFTGQPSEVGEVGEDVGSDNLGAIISGAMVQLYASNLTVVGQPILGRLIDRFRRSNARRTRRRRSVQSRCSQVSPQKLARLVKTPRRPTCGRRACPRRRSCRSSRRPSGPRSTPRPRLRAVAMFTGQPSEVGEVGEDVGRRRRRRSRGVGGAAPSTSRPTTSARSSAARWCSSTLRT